MTSLTPGGGSKLYNYFEVIFSSSNIYFVINCLSLNESYRFQSPLFFNWRMEPLEAVVNTVKPGIINIFIIINIINIIAINNNNNYYYY